MNGFQHFQACDEFSRNLNADQGTVRGHPVRQAVVQVQRQGFGFRIQPDFPDPDASGDSEMVAGHEETSLPDFRVQCGKAGEMPLFGPGRFKRKQPQGDDPTARKN